MRLAAVAAVAAVAAIALVALAPSSGAQAPGRVRELATMTSAEVRALDRAKTVVILPGGIMEEHGPWLPIESDGYLNDRIAREVADSVAARGMTALVFPSIPLGTGPANEVGGLYTFPGSFPVRSATLRAVYMDLADEIGTQGFRWAFVVSAHGAPNHNRTLDAAGAYFHDTYGGRMVHLGGMMPVLGATTSLPAAQAAEAGFEIHAGSGETGYVLALRPDLVDSGYRTTKPEAGASWAALRKVAAAPGWPGYFGSPRLATAERGATDVRLASAAAAHLASGIVDGTVDESTVPRLGTLATHTPDNVAIDRASLVHEAASRKRQEAWLSTSTRRPPVARIAPVALEGAPSARGVVRQLAEMTSAQVRALDHAHTVVILPGGILEEHGPYLPIESDGFTNARLAADLADSLAGRGLTVLAFPMIPLGTGPANEVGGLFTFPGSFPVRTTTLRSIYMDLADELGVQGFRWVFVVHGHGAPDHNRMLDQAGDYFRDTYGGRMVHLAGMMPVLTSEGARPAAEVAETGREIHAGSSETSDLLALRPDLVDSGYRAAAPQAGRDLAALRRLGAAPNWPGYFGSPRLATAERGDRDVRLTSVAAVRLALGIVSGSVDERAVPRLGTLAEHVPDNAAIDRAAVAHEAASRKRQEAWLRRKGLE